MAHARSRAWTSGLNRPTAFLPPDSCYPILYHDIAEEIPAKGRRVVREGYMAWYVSTRTAARGGGCSKPWGDCVVSPDHMPYATFAQAPHRLDLHSRTAGSCLTLCYASNARARRACASAYCGTGSAHASCWARTPTRRCPAGSSDVSVQHGAACRGLDGRGRGGGVLDAAPGVTTVDATDGCCQPSRPCTQPRAGLHAHAALTPSHHHAALHSQLPAPCPTRPRLPSVYRFLSYS